MPIQVTDQMPVESMLYINTHFLEPQENLAIRLQGITNSLQTIEAEVRSQSLHQSNKRTITQA